MYQIFKDFAGPVATIIASITAALVTLFFALRQMRIAKQQADTAKQQADTALDQLRYNLFEKRVAIYEEVKALIRHLVNTPKADLIDASDVVPHYANMIEARFFFSDEICSWLDDLQGDCQKFLEMRDTGTPGEYHASMIRLVEHLRGMAERFDTELGFRQLTRRASNQPLVATQQDMGVDMADPNRNLILKELDHIQAIIGRYDTFFFTSKNVFVVAVSAMVLYYSRDGDAINGPKLLALAPIITVAAFVTEYLFRYHYWSGYILRIETIQDSLNSSNALSKLYVLKEKQPRKKRFRKALQTFDIAFYGMFFLAFLVYMLLLRWPRFEHAYGSLFFGS